MLFHVLALQLGTYDQKVPCALASIWALHLHVATACVGVEVSLQLPQLSLPLAALSVEGTANLQLTDLSLECLVLQVSQVLLSTVWARL